MSQLYDTVKGLLSGPGEGESAIKAVESIATDELGLPLLSAGGGRLSLITFALSAHGHSLPESRFLVGLWAMDECESTGDTSSAINLLGWAEQEIDAGGPPSPVRRRLSDFLVHCARAAPPVRMSLLDLMVGLGPKVAKVVTAAAGAHLVSALEDLRDASDELTRKDFAAIAALVAGEELPPSIEALPDLVGRMTASLEVRARNTLAPEQRAELGTWLAKLHARERAAHRASAAETRVMELAVGGSRVTMGPFGQLLVAADHLIGSLSQALFPGVTAPIVEPFAAVPGSFAVHAAISGREGVETIDELESILSKLDDPEQLRLALERKEEVAKRLGDFLGAVLDQDAPVRAAFLHPRSARSISHLSFPGDVSNRVRAWLGQEAEQPLESRRVVGTLMAADLKHGSFICRVGKEDVAGKVPNPALLQKVHIGRQYVFVLNERRVVKPVGVLRRVELVRLDEPEDLAGDAAGREDEGLLPRGSVPQAALNRVERVVDHISGTNTLRPLDLGVESGRSVSYHLSAARILGLIDRDNELTTFGRLWVGKSPRGRMRRLAAKFEETHVAQAWCEWAGAVRINEVEPDSAEDFLRDSTNLSPSTCQTRAGHLARWLTAFEPYLDEDEGGEGQTGDD